MPLLHRVIDAGVADAAGRWHPPSHDDKKRFAIAYLTSGLLWRQFQYTVCCRVFSSMKARFSWCSV